MTLTVLKQLTLNAHQYRGDVTNWYVPVLENF